MNAIYKIALISPTFGQIVLPVNPERLEIAQDGLRETYRLLNIGQVVIPGGRGLRSFRFSSLLPADRQPDVFIERLGRIMETKEVVRLIITRTDMAGSLLWDTNCQAVIGKFSWYEKGGEVGVVFFDLELTEYRAFSVRQLV